MPDASSGGIEVDAMLPRKLFDRRVFRKVLLGLVLYVMIESEDRLPSIMDLRGAYGIESGCFNPSEKRGK